MTRHVGKCILAWTVALYLMAPRAACGADNSSEWPHFYPDDPLVIDADDTPVPEPAYRSTSQYYDFLENTFLDAGRDIRRKAANVNTLGQVPNSSWFTNRHGFRLMSPQEMVSGPSTGKGPDVEGKWTITSAKSEGITPGFTVKDSRGDTYFIKIDPIEYPRMSTSSEAICTPLFHAMGYNVPENYLVDVGIDNIVIGENTTIKFADGAKKKMTRKHLRSVLQLAPVNPDRTLRVIASKAVPGKGLFDHFRYYGTRPDDANDIIPHQFRRELRGLRIFAAWLNHDDARSINTLDVYTEEQFVKHYLIDFGSCLGSGSVKPQTYRAGNEHMWEAGPTFKTLATLGLWVRPYLKIEYPEYRCIGRFESKKFDPELWRPEYPNPAFDAMDDYDAFWASRILMRFTDDHIRAVVEAGGLDDAEATEYMIETLAERRDKIGGYYLNRVNPLDEFEVEGEELKFQNLAVKYGFGQNPKMYEITWSEYDNQARSPQGVIERASVAPGGDGTARTAIPPDSSAESGYLFVEIVPSGDAPTEWKAPVSVFLRNRRPGWEVVGIYR